MQTCEVQVDDVASAPLAGLYPLGDYGGNSPAKWPDYLAEFDLGPQHIDALIALATDKVLLESDYDAKESWAPIHALRALGQLRAESAVAPLLSVLPSVEDDAFSETVPEVFGLIGAPALPQLASVLAAPGDRSQARIAIVDAIREIAKRHPDCREACVAMLAQLLQPHPDSDSEVNGFAVSALLDIKAVEAIDTIRDAYARGEVEEWVAGDLEDVEIDLGLRTKRSTPKPRYETPILKRLLGEAGAREFATLAAQRVSAPVVREKKVGRNEPCPCGSGKKYKKCCLS